VAPLLGLLGTVLGMIQTFSRLSSAQGAIDMTTLADGIWQALLTTAAGLLIAIPAVAAHQVFLRREDGIAFAMGRLANLSLARWGDGRAP
jgi:biopolymer transport protein ExbB